MLGGIVFPEHKSLVLLSATRNFVGLTLSLVLRICYDFFLCYSLIIPYNFLFDCFTVLLRADCFIVLLSLLLLF